MMPPILLGFLASLLTGLATGLGALPVLFFRKISQKVQSILLGFGGGVMLAASAFSLIIPGTDAAVSLGYTKPVAALIMVVGILLGGALLWLGNRYFPHEHFIKGPEGANSDKLKRIWLFVAAITLHNFPEGMAVGVGFGGGNLSEGIPLALGIGLQNMPEGLVVAVSLVAQKYSVGYALWIALLSGLVEPIGGLLGAGVVSLAQVFLPWAMAFAAGAMLFVISDEIIPESHSQGFALEGTVGVMVGFVVMMFLDIALS